MPALKKRLSSQRACFPNKGGHGNTTKPGAPSEAGHPPPSEEATPLRWENRGRQARGPQACPEAQPPRPAWDRDPHCRLPPSLNKSRCLPRPFLLPHATAPQGSRRTPAPDSGEVLRPGEQGREAAGPAKGPARRHTSGVDPRTATPPPAPRRALAGCSPSLLYHKAPIRADPAPGAAAAAGGRRGHSPYLHLALLWKAAAPRFPSRRRSNPDRRGDGCRLC